MKNAVEVAKKVATKIKMLRGTETQKEFAQKLGVSPQAVSDWENANKIPRMGVIERLSIMYGVPKSYILGEDEDLDKLTATGIRKPTGEIHTDNKTLDDIIGVISDLPDEAIAHLDNYVKFLVQEFKSKEE